MSSGLVGEPQLMSATRCVSKRPTWGHTSECLGNTHLAYRDGSGSSVLLGVAPCAPRTSGLEAREAVKVGVALLLVAAVFLCWPPGSNDTSQAGSSSPEPRAS